MDILHGVTNHATGARTIDPDQAEKEAWAMISTLITVSLSGMLMSGFYFIFNYLYYKIRGRLMCSLSISSSDEIYKMTLDFLTAKGYLKGSLTQLKCQMKKKGFTWWWTSAKEENKKPEVEYLPGPGNHIFTYQGKTMWAA
jgi:hypothetical protein